MTRASIFFMLTLVLAFFACKHTVPDQNPEPGGGTGGGGTGGGGTGSGGTAGNCYPDTIYFQQQVLPILVSNCTMSGCHDQATAQKGVILTSYQSVMATADIDPYDPWDSKLYKRIMETDPSKRMPRPPAAPLSQAQKDIIYKWIQQGAKNLTCQTGCDNSGPSTYNATVLPILTQKCTGCHGGTSPQAGINLTTYAGLKSKIDDNRFWGAINHLPGFSAMPKNGNKLSECELAKIKKWLDAGALNN